MSNSPEKYSEDFESHQPSRQMSPVNENKGALENSNTKLKSMSQDRITDKEDERSLESNALLDSVNKLEEQLRSCIKFQKFAEAEEIQTKLKTLKLEFVVKRSKEIQARHVEEMNQMIASQNIEIENFKLEWENKIADYKREAQEAELEMMKKHNSDLNALEEDLRTSLPLFLRTSPKILNLRKMIDTLAKQKEFVQADKLKFQCTKLEEEELMKSEEQKESKIVHILTQLANKQKNELNCLKKRVSTGFASLLKTRDTESLQLSHKLQNMRQVIENTQQLELAKFEVAYKNYVPGETLKFKSRKKRGTSGTPVTNSVYSNSMNSSYCEGVTKNYFIPLNSNNRNLPSMRKDTHIRGRPSVNSSQNKSVLIPINPGRFVSNPKERVQKVN